jgi:drug/metabolite transporter (DMT)-like permease
MESHHGRVKLLLAFAAIYFIWGSTFLAIRFAVQTLPPLLTMGTRHLAAGTLLFAWLGARGILVRPEPRLWLPALFCGACCFLGCHGLLAWAEIRIDSGLAALLSSTLPIWMVLLAPMRGQESELNPRVLAGIALGFAGVAVLIPMNFTGPQPEGLRALAILAAEILWAVGAMYARGVKSSTPAATFAAMQMVSGGGLLWVVGLALGEGSRLHAAAFTARPVLSLVFLIVFGSLIAFSAYVWLLQVSSPAIVSTHSYVNPLVAVVLGWALAHEAVTWRTALGTSIILASVALVSLHRRRPFRKLDNTALRRPGGGQC